MYYYLVFTIVAHAIYYFITRKLTYWENKKVNGPKPIPFFGNYKDVALRRKAKFALYNEIYNQYPKEKVVGVYQMLTPSLVIRDLDIVKQILITDFQYFPDRGIHYSKKGLGENMIHCEGEAWKHLRHHFTALFTSSKMKNIIHILVDRGDRFVNYLQNSTANNEEKDAYSMVFKYCAATTIATTYGWDIDTFNDDRDWFNTLDEQFINTYWQEIDLVLPGILKFFNLSVATKETIKTNHRLLKMCLKQKYSDSNTINVKNVLLHLKDQNQNDKSGSQYEITNDLLAGQLWVFHMAGYVNNTLVMTYTLYQLALNQTIQEKLRAEVDETMKKCDDKLTYELLKEMNYMMMVFAETLRIHPTSHYISRNVVKNIKINGTDVTLDKGSTVIIPIHAIQHDEKYYSKPAKFNPERFCPENAKDIHPFSFLSFGAGRRGCLATQYARLQYAVGLSKLLYHFRVEISSNTCREIAYDPYHMLVKPKPGLQLKFIRLEK